MGVNIYLNDSGGGSTSHTSSSGSSHGGSGGTIGGLAGTTTLKHYGTNATNALHQQKLVDSGQTVADFFRKYGTNVSQAYHQAKLNQEAVNAGMNFGFGSGSPVGNTTGTIPNNSTTRTSSIGISEGGQFGNYMDMLRAIQSENNAFNIQQTEMVNAFNASEAQKNRDWQQWMAEHAHQIEVADLQKAGLNPVLSALNGNGASVGSGAVASGQKAVADDTTSRGVIGIINGLINATTASAVASIYANASVNAASIGAGATRYSADTHSAATRYAADRSAISNLTSSILRALT